MDNLQKLELMDKIIRELDDLKSSQTSVLKKIGQIEADNINLDAKILNEKLPTIYENVDTNVKLVTGLHDDFIAHREKFFTDKNLSAIVDPTA
jgi:hypothetical protein